VTEAMTNLAVSRNADDYLGPGAQRFFGAGYRRAVQRLTDLTVTVGAEGRGTVAGRAAVAYPADWSRKGTTDQPPHLSSIDVLLITAETAEVYLTRALALTPADRATLRLRSVQLLAGTRPVEDELPGFDIWARIGRSRPAADGAALSVVQCQVGTLRARVEILHPAAAPIPGTATYADAGTLLGPGSLRPYAIAHRDKTQTVDNIELDLPARSGSARLATAWTTPEDSQLTGVDSGAHRGVSIMDTFVAAIQLGQILLYELDAVSRADSRTLWMRRTTLNIDRPGQPASGPGILRARLTDTELLTAGDGAQWRSARIEAAFAHFRVACAVAHQLPTQHGETT
jgi:hypothetical protein